MEKIKLTLVECQMLLREHGLKISHKALSDGIANGLYPFGRVTNTGDSGRRTVFILRHDVERWLREMEETK